MRRTLEHKLWFDEVYDTVFARPAQAIAVRLRDQVETPVVQGGLDEVAEGTLDAAGSRHAPRVGCPHLRPRDHGHRVDPGLVFLAWSAEQC